MIGLELALICANNNCDDCPEKAACERLLKNMIVYPLEY